MSHDAFWIRFTIVRVLLLVMIVALAVTESGCRGTATPPPPLAHGRCEAAEYSREQVTAQRCTLQGRVWLCYLAGERASTCSLISSPPRAPAAEGAP